MDIQEVIKKENTMVIDVREAFELASGKVDGAVHMPLSKFRDYLDTLKGHNGDLVFYCRSGNRSGKAVQFLKGMGMKNVYNGGDVFTMKMFLVEA